MRQATNEVQRGPEPITWEQMVGMMHGFQTIAYERYMTPMGGLWIAAMADGVATVDWITDSRFLELEEIPAQDPEAKKWADECVLQLDQYFHGERRQFDLKLSFHGTRFQELVWRALQKIPYGQTRSYLDIARAIGNSKAVRAVGQANRKNRHAVIVPCHRVVGADGELVGYAGSHLDLKAQLLEMEARFMENSPS